MTTFGFFQRLFTHSLIISLLVTCLPRAPVIAASPLKIGEVAWAGSSLSTSDEWLEIWNQSDVPLSLSGYSLIGASPAPLFFPADATIPAYGTYIITNYPDTDPKSVLATTPQLVTSTLALSNSVLQIKLFSPDGTEIDQSGDGQLPLAGTNTSIKASMLRQGESWMTATSSKNIDTPATDFGTPGMCDDCVPTISTPTALSEVIHSVIEPLPQIASSSSSSTDIQITSSTETVIPSTIETPPIAVVSSTNDIPPIVDISSSSSAIVSESETTTSSLDTFVGSPQISDASISASEATTTSTETMDEVGVVVEENVTSTIEILELSQNSTAAAAATTTTAISLNKQSTTSTSSTSSTIQLATVIDNPSLLRLNEIMAYPETGHEWIEITATALTAPLYFQNLELHDATGKIAMIPTSTLDQNHPFLLIELNSSRLNNDGDTVTLQTTSGTVLDALAYDTASKGKSFSRIPDGTGIWKETLDITPNAQNIYIPPPTSPPVSNTAPPNITIVNPPITTSQTVASSPIVTSASIPKKSTTPNKTIPKPTKPVIRIPSISAPSVSTSTYTSPSPTLFTHPSSTKTVKVTKKVTAPKKVASTRPSMKPTGSSSQIHVTLHGAVGSPPGLVAAHTFILLSPDGKGLEVHSPASHQLPLLGESIEVHGVLAFNANNIPYVKTDSASPWTRATTSTAAIPLPRSIDLIAPSQEDAWSLTSVTGTITSIRSGTIMLAMGSSGEEIGIAIRPEAHYRAKRLVIGDTLRITGLLDMTGVEPRLIPRQAEDILFLRHAELKPQNTAPQTLPGWTPFGAAGIAVAGTEGLKKLRERQKVRALQNILRQASTHDV